MATTDAGTNARVSVLNRESLLRHPPPHSLHTAHSLDEAFAAKHMPDLGHKLKEFEVFHWKLQGWKKLNRKLTSAEFDCGGHRWYVLPAHLRLSHSRHPLRRILLFPFGNFNNAAPTETVSLYLDSANPNTPEGWHAYAQFALVISNPHDPTIYTVHRA